MAPPTLCNCHTVKMMQQTSHQKVFEIRLQFLSLLFIFLDELKSFGSTSKISHSGSSPITTL